MNIVSFNLKNPTNTKPIQLVNPVQNLTIGVKTFCRPDTLEYALDYSIHTMVNAKINIRIIISDDSRDDVKETNNGVIRKLHEKYLNLHIQKIDLPFDSGLSIGRNRIVDECKTEYIFIVDDSRTFPSDILKMVTFLQETHYDLIGCIIPNRHGINSYYSGKFHNITDISGHTYVSVQRIDKEKDEIKNTCNIDTWDTDIMLNVFVARTELLRQVKWRPELKLQEHDPFFYDLYRHGAKCAITPSIRSIEVPFKYRRYPPGLESYRGRHFKTNVTVKMYK